jgi:hypothetical protein
MYFSKYRKLFVIAIALITIVMIILGFLLFFNILKLPQTKEKVLIEAFKKEYLVPRAMNIRNFATFYLLDYGAYNPQKMDVLHEFFLHSQNDPNFDENCKELFKKQETSVTDLMYSELISNLSQIIVYRCFYVENSEAKNLMKTNNLNTCQMLFDQKKDQEFIKKQFRIESIDSCDFQLNIDKSLRVASKNKIITLIDYL